MATKYILNGHYKNKYKFIIVDEYQDINKAKYNMLYALKLSKNFKLFSLGDDWQSIYKSTSSDINLITNYNKYFKDLNVKDIINKDKTELVSNEKLSYSKYDKYKDGVKITVSSNYSVLVLESGIIVYIGNKDDYDSTIIVQQINGIDLLYGNIENTNYKLYDYVKKKDILGVSNKYLYLVFKKDGKVLDYEKYI